MGKISTTAIILSIMCFLFLTTCVTYSEAKSKTANGSVSVQDVRAYRTYEQNGAGEGGYGDDIFGTEAKIQEYTVGTKDVLSISVWGHPDLNVKPKVGMDGAISMPLLGEVYVHGMTVDEVEKVIKTLLAKDYIVDPNVDVNIEEFNSKSIFIFGDVKEPGEYKLKGYTTVLDVFPMSGGTIGGLDKTMLITRKVTEKDIAGRKSSEVARIGVKVVDLKRLLVHGDMSQNYHIEPGDIIYVYSPDTKGAGEHIYILGAVKNPGIFGYKYGLTALDAIILAGGFTDLAAPNSTMVVRGEGEDKQTMRVKMGSIMKNGDRTEDVELEPGDFVIVREGWL